MEYIIPVQNCKIMATVCCVVASNWLTKATCNKYHTFWMKPKILAIAHAIDSSALFICFLIHLAYLFVYFNGNADVFRG